MMDGDCLESSLGSRGAENGDCGRDTSTFMDTDGFGTIEVHQKGTKFFESKEKVRFNQYEDGHEACSGTEGLYFGDVPGKADIEVRSAKIGMTTYQCKRKKNKKLLSEGIFTAFCVFLFWFLNNFYYKLHSSKGHDHIFLLPVKI